MILCLTLNAAIDKTVEVDGFGLNAIHRPKSVLMLPGGKGCNVARVLQQMGEPALVSGFVGGYAGGFIENALHCEGIQTAFVHTENESRTCLSILDRQADTLTEIYEKGDPILDQVRLDFLDLFKNMLPNCNIVILSGSLPQGLPSDFYAHLIEIAHAAGKIVFLDTNGEPLMLGVKNGGPALIKPNQSELKVLLPGEFSSPVEIGEATHDLARRLNMQIAVSLGAKGLVFANQDEVWLATPPQVDVISAVGSGDSLLAGLAIGRIRGLPIEEMLRLAVALGAANTLMLGAGQFRTRDVEMLESQIRIQLIS